MASSPYQPPDRKEAISAFETLRSGELSQLSTPPERNPFIDYLVDQMIAFAGQQDLVVAVHTGYWGDFRLLDPLHMIPLLQRHPTVRFDIYHLGFPWVREALMLGKGFPNVWLNLCWTHIISQRVVVSALDEAIDLIPSNKLLAFGGDYGLPVEKVYGHLVMAQEDIAEVLARRVAENQMTEDSGNRPGSPLVLGKRSRTLQPEVREGSMNIILVIFDSLRKDCLEAYGAPPWGKVLTPHFNAFAEESLMMTRAYPESLPTLPARRAIYTGQRVYPFHNSNFRLKGDFAGAPGWGPIPEDQATLAEILREAGYRTALISDVFHMFKPSKNFWRGFDQWTFLRGQEADPSRSGPRLSQAELDYWLPPDMQMGRYIEFTQQCIMNLRDRVKEEDYFAPRVLKEAALWLEQNQDAEKFFLTVKSFDPHEPWLVPSHYQQMYSKGESREQVISKYGDVSTWDPALISRTQANYSGAVTLCDHWFGFFMERLRCTWLCSRTLWLF